MDTRGHYIAQFHLKNFKVDRDEVQRRLGKKLRKRPHLWVWSRLSGTSELIAVRDCAHQIDLYAQPPEDMEVASDEDYTDNRVEDALSKIEGIASPHFEKLRRRGSKCDANSLGYIIEYTMIQFCRTPARLEAVASGMARAMDAAVRANEQRESFAPELIPITLYDRDAENGSTELHSRVNEHVVLHKRSCWGATLKSVDTLLRWGEKASWEVLWAPHGEHFVIGDDPVIMLNPLNPSGRYDGLAFTGTEIAMPLSPSVTICGRLLRGGTYTRHRTASLEELETLNARQFFRARAAVYSKSRTQSPATSRIGAYRPMSP